MDLSSLKATLEARDARPVGEPSDADLEGPSVVDEIFARHRNSTQPESQQLRVILSSILEVIAAEGLQPTPTALFAAAMSSLQRPETAASPEVAAAMCNLLAIVMSRVPTSVLRSRAVQSAQVLVDVIEGHGGSGTVPRAALPCLSQALAAMGPGDWPAMSRGFGLLLTACLDAQPKLRKKAHAGLVDVLAALQGVAPALGPASEAVLKLSQRVLPGPEAAAKAAAAAPGKKRQQAEEAITAAVTDALHFMSALRQVVALLTGPAAQGVCELLLRLYPLRQPLLSRGATDTLAALCASSASHLSPAALGDLLNAVLLSEASWDKRDFGSALSMTRLLEEGALRLAAADPAAAAAVLPRIVHALVPQLASQQEGVRRGTSLALRNVLSACLVDSEVAAAVAAAGRGPGRKLSSVQRVVSAVEASLGPQYRDGWEGSLGVAGELLERLGRPGAALAEGVVIRIGQLCAGVDDLAADEDEEAAEEESRLTTAAQSALGVALRALGPEAVLAALPLQLEEGLAGTDEARTWMLPLLRMHVRGARVGFWQSEMLPLARAMGARAAAAARDPARHREANVCATLETQIWATLPSFCSWAEDVGQVFPSLSKAIAPAFERRAELRTPVCNALRRVAAQSRAALRAAGVTVGHADPTLTLDDEAGPSAAHKNEEESQDVHDEVPASYSQETAAAAAEALHDAAESWLPLLLNAFVNTPANQRGHIGAAIAGYACVCAPETVATLFRAALMKLMKVSEQARTGELGRDSVMEGGDSDTERVCTFMEAALLLGGGLDASGAAVLWKAALPGTKEKDPSVQKKSYKIMAYLCESRPDFSEPNFAAVLSALADGTATAVSAAKRYRLRCLKAAILDLVRPDGPQADLSGLPGVAAGASHADAARALVTPMVTEIVLCVKEANKRSRALAFELLVDVARAMHEAEPPTADGDGGLRSLVNIVLGGLVGATPHMVSAAVMSLARLLFEFAPVLAGLVPALLPSVLALLRSKAREVIKAVLGFVKVVAMRLPAAELAVFVPAICEGILLWAEDSKNKFRLKVRVILERLARRCGFEVLEKAVPEAHRALLTHIRKQNNRKERRRAGASEMDWDGDDDGDDGRSVKSRARTARTGRTAARSAWNSDVFSDEEEDGRATTVGGRSAKTAGGATARRGLGAGRSVRSAPQGAAGARRLPSSEDPLDLLDVGTARKMVRGGGSGSGSGRGAGGRKDEDDVNFDTGKDGRMVILEERPVIGKRKRTEAEEAGFESDDSDFEDLKGYTGLKLALKGSKSVAAAPSIAASIGGKSLGGRSARTAGGRSTKSGAGGGGRGSQHSGDRFKSKKAAGGDVKGSSKVEPYAYWPLDRKLMNRRASKTRTAKAGLDKVVAAAKAGAAKGLKAKRARR